MRRRPRRVSKRTIFVVLLVVTFVAIWLPIRWTRPLSHLMQLFAPAQQALSTATGGAGGLLGDLGNGSVPASEHQELARRNQALENRIISLAQQVRQLEALTRELTALRDSGLRHPGRLIPSRVVRFDAAPWRDGILLDRGQASGASTGQAVVSAILPPGQTSSGAEALASEFLVGEVVDTAPYTATVRLLSDPQSQIKVGAGRVEGGRFVVLSSKFLLRGVGAGRMVILDVPQSYVESGQVRVGDTVVSVDGQFGLPVPLMVGRIAHAEPDPRQPHLLYRLEVHPPAEVRSLGRLYIVDMGPKQ